MTNKKTISIVISAYKSQEFIEQALYSIENQTYFINNDNYEVLIGVDACEETLQKILEIRYGYRNIRVFMMKENRGTYITTNTLLDLVKYDNVLRFDSDDIMCPEMVEEMIQYVDEAEIIRCKYYSYNSATKQSLYENIYFHNGIVMFKTIVFETCGGYQPWVCSADTELLRRATAVFNEKLVNKYLFYYRKHGGSLTNNVDMRIRVGYHRQMNNETKINRVVNEYYEK
jgi:glycosyltransferase involved in cell wall biosynthesis